MSTYIFSGVHELYILTEMLDLIQNCNETDLSQTVTAQGRRDRIWRRFY